MRGLTACTLGALALPLAAAAPASFAHLTVNGKQCLYGKTSKKVLTWEEHDNLSLQEEKNQFYLSGSFKRKGRQDGFELYFPKEPGTYIGRRNPDTWRVETSFNFDSTPRNLHAGSYHVDARPEDFGFLEVRLEDRGNAWHGTFTARCHKYAKNRPSGVRYVTVEQRDAVQVSGEFNFLKQSIYKGRSMR